MAQPAQPSFKLFAGSASQSLGKELASTLGCPLAASTHSALPNGDPYVELHEPLAGLDVYLLQSLSSSASWHLLELLLMADIAQRQGAQRITAIIPYYSYGRQDKAEKQGQPLAASLIAKLLAASGIQRVVLIHGHSAKVQTLFDIPVVDVSPLSLFVGQIRLLSKDANLCFLAPDAGAHPLALEYARIFQGEAALVLKERTNAYQVRTQGLLGKVEGKHIWVVDDCLQTGQTLAQAAHLARHTGALSVSAAITHLDPSATAPQLIQDLHLTHFLSTHSCEGPYIQPKALNVHLLSISSLLRDALNLSST